MPTKYTCEQCGKGFKGWSGNRNRFCSHRCHSQALIVDPIARFWDRVGKTDGCWTWSGQIDPDGYGVLPVRTRPVRAHRFSWTLHYGPIPPGMAVLHRCDNPPCVRPDHLWLGTLGDNNRDRSRKGRSATGLQAGPHLHPETRPRGERVYGAELTESAVREIRERFRAGETCAAMAAAYGVSPSTLENIVRRRTWRHVTP